MEWKSGNWCKQVIIIPAPTKLIVDALQDKRGEWDWLFTGYRIISSPENSKIFLCKAKSK
jgi:hypothetical protein